MERINQFALYDLGQRLQRLRMSFPIDVRDAYSPVAQARSTLARLIKGEPIPIGISASKAQELQQELEWVWSWYYFEHDEQGNEILDDAGKPKFKHPKKGEKSIEEWTWSSIIEALGKFETVFAEEMRESSAYHIQQRGIISVSALVENGEKAFPEEFAHIIGMKALADFKAACRCFAFDLYTASGYHSARAVEAVIEIYYQTFCNKPGETKHSWNDYVDALKKLKDKKPKKPKFLPDARTLLSVDEIRTHHRNPLMHPRATLSEIDADMLLSIAKVAIMAMAQEIQKVWLERKVVATRIKAKQAR